MKIKTITLALLLILLAFTLVAMTINATYSLTWFTMDGGGGESVGGEYALSGTIGQPDASSSMEGGDYDLTGGFWGGLALGSIPPIPVTGEITIYMPLVER